MSRDKGSALAAAMRSASPRGRYARSLMLSLPLACGVLAALPAQAQAQTQDDAVQSLRRDMQEMQRQHEAALKKLEQDYNARLKRMEERLDASQRAVAAAQSKADQAQRTATAGRQQPAAAPSTPPAAAAPAAPAPEPAPASSADAAPKPSSGGTPASANSFNPAIGVVLDGKFMASRNNPGKYRLPGFALGDEAKPPPRGLSIGESELNFQANVDQALFGNLTISFDRDNEVSIEEAFIQSMALPAGFTVRVGRFFSGVGYLNEQHAHTWDFADAPLPYRAFFGSQYGDDGVQVRWLAPTDQFLEFGAEVMRGAAFPAGGRDDHHLGVGAFSAFVHTGGDIGDSANYRVGVSYLQARAKDRTTDGLTGDDIFSGTTRTFGVDGVFKWAPDGNFAERYVKLQAEAFLQRLNGGFNGIGLPGNTAVGFYVQGVYQFMPRWRVGLRYDQVRAKSLGPTFAGTTLDNLGTTPRRYSAMVDFSTSEFGRFRAQYNLEQTQPHIDHQLIFQYTVSFGSHGAHQY